MERCLASPFIGGGGWLAGKHSSSTSMPATVVRGRLLVSSSSTSGEGGKLRVSWSGARRRRGDGRAKGTAQVGEVAASGSGAV